MINKIVELIEVKTKNRPNSVLYTQWNASKDYVFQNLNAISQMFPHYSLHDRSHSEAILTNIVRIVGDETLEKRFSAEDLWLLLCSACYHDLGMYVSGEEQHELMTNENFIEHIRKIQKNEKSYLHVYSTYFDIQDNTLIQKETQIQDKTINAIDFLIADYIRKSHGVRSAKKIQKDEKLYLQSIPKRLQGILGEICRNHTSAFEEVMSLPHTEKGIDVEDCHPRYIACLLRLGDLLDMDNNRFSNVILSTLPSIPLDSIHHKAKHFSINHLEISTKKISATATCEDVDVADLTQQWFAMLNDEVINQMKKWSDIVPDSSYGFLPTLGDLHVTLQGYDTIDGKIKNSFQIDTSKALELLQGAGLYNSPIQSIREILQNAVDATLLRIYCEDTEQWRLPHSDIRKMYEQTCKKYPIKVYISRNAQLSTDEKITWEIKIIDQGYGMSLEDIKVLTQISCDKTNTKKNRIIQRMPEWMKPSGIFGIGFQSIYLIADIVYIKTHQYNSELTYDITLYNPIKEKDGLVLLKTDSNNTIQHGTEIKFNLIVEKIPSKWSVNIGDNSAWKTLNTYDFISCQSLDLDMAKIIDEILQFSYASDIPIMIYDEKEEVFDSAKGVSNIFKETPNAYFSANYNIEIVPQFTEDHKRYINRTYYRGQVVKYNNRLRFADFTINILRGNAKDILTLSRNEIKGSYYTTLQELIIATATEYIIEKYESFKQEEKEWASMFLNFYNCTTENYLLKYNAWETHTIKPVNEDDNLKTIRELCAYDNIVFRQYDSYEKPFSIPSKKHLPLYEVNQEKISTVVIYYDYNSDDAFFLHKIIRESHPYSNIDFYENKWNKHEIVFSKNKPNKVIGDMKMWLNMYMHADQQYARGLMPCPIEYDKLAVNLNDDIKEILNYIYCGYLPYQGPVMVCPYVKTYNNISCSGLKYDIAGEKLYSFVYKHRLDKSTTMEEIKKKYEQFYNDTKDLL